MGGCDATKCVRNTDCADGYSCQAAVCTFLGDAGPVPDGGPRAADGGRDGGS